MELHIYIYIYIYEAVILGIISICEELKNTRNGLKALAPWSNYYFLKLNIIITSLQKKPQSPSVQGQI